MSTDNSEDEAVSSDFENELEELFKHRYTDEDKEYQEVVAQETAPPPAVIPWHTKSKRNYDWSGYHGRDRRGWHGGRGGGGGGGGGYRDRGYHDRDGGYYDRNSGYRNYHNRNDGYHYRDRSSGYHNYGGSGGGYHGGGGGGGYHGGRNHGGGGGYRGGYQNNYQGRPYYNRDRYNPYQRN